MDALSQMPHYWVQDAEDHKQQVILQPDYFVTIAANHLSQAPQNKLEERMRKLSKREVEVLEALKGLKEGEGLRRLAEGLLE